MTNQEQKELFQAMFKIEGDKVEFQQMELIHLLQEMGYGICRDEQSPYNNQLIYKRNNVLEIFNEKNLAHKLVSLMKAHELDKKLIEKFVRGSAGYLAQNKLQFLKAIELDILQDTRNTTYIPFMNKLIKVTRNGYEVTRYKDIEGSILSDSRIKKTFTEPETSEGCNFKEFCKMITGYDEARFNSLKSILGYLLHTNKEAQENKIVILYDAETGTKTSANGGTGKTLLINGAIKQLRNVTVIDGKRYDERTNRFLYQNVNPYTNTVFLDDVNDKFTLEDIFSVSTGDFEVEKKGKQSFILEYKYAPKFVVSSNREVKMISGASSERRKIELVLDNIFNAAHTPKDHFNEIFFSDDWNDEAFNRFYLFMIECIVYYHQHGLIECINQDIINSRLRGLIGSEMFDAIETIVEYTNGIWNIKKEAVEVYNDQLDLPISSILFTKSLKKYCQYKGYKYEEKNAGSVLSFKITDSDRPIVIREELEEVKSDETTIDDTLENQLEPKIEESDAQLEEEGGSNE